jgi:hypothetical protein
LAIGYQERERERERKRVISLHIQAKMIYDRETYQAMMNVVQRVIQEQRAIIPMDAIEANVSYNALVSLFSQYHIKEVKKDSYRLKIVKEKLLSMAHSKSLQLIHFAKENRIGFYKLAKTYLEEVYGNQTKISTFLSNPDMVEDERIRNELIYLINNDLYEAPHINVIKESMGREYERLLTSLLNKYHFLYETESEMRKKGKPKTPDVWFTIPMATIANSFEEHLLQGRNLLTSLQFPQTPIPSQVNFQSPGRIVSTSNFDPIGALAVQDRMSPCQNPSAEIDDNLRQHTLTSFDLQKPVPTQMESAGLFIDQSADVTDLLPPPPLMPNMLLREISGSDDLKGELPGNDQMEEQSYVIINWIDSKAMFADLETFREHSQQLYSYYIRYGRGMVIYWHGMVEEIFSSDLYLAGHVIVRDSFPEKWIFPTGEVADGNSPTFDVPSSVFASMPAHLD